MSTLLLIPWIIFGFKNPHYRCLGLTQTKKSILRLLVLEIVFWTLLFLLLDKPDPRIAGQGSFAWMYILFYEKGIIPTCLIAESIDSSLGDRIDSNYQFIYLLVALCVDYLLLFLISSRVTRLFNLKKTLMDK
jgi:hypothetical protein